jgi:hypothetical protein
MTGLMTLFWRHQTYDYLYYYDYVLLCYSNILLLWVLVAISIFYKVTSLPL